MTFFTQPSVAFSSNFLIYPNSNAFSSPKILFIFYSPQPTKWLKKWYTVTNKIGVGGSLFSWKTSLFNSSYAFPVQ